MEVLRYIAAEAERFLSEGKPAVADLIARECLLRDPADAAAWAALAHIATAVGETAAAASYARIAAELSPPAVPPVSAPDRYLLIKAWGNGFCADLDHVLGCLLLCEITGRRPVTHWGTNSLFSVEPAKDAFREYFEPLSQTTLDDLTGKGYAFWPPKWNATNLRTEGLQKHQGAFSRISTLEMLNRPEQVVVSDYHSGVALLAPWIRPGHSMRGKTVEEIYQYLIAKHLVPMSDIRRMAEAFAEEHFGPGPVIAVHVRGGDKYKEDAEILQKMAAYPQAIDAMAQGNALARIFLLTDDALAVEDYRRRYGSRLITTDCLRTTNHEGVHFMAPEDRRRLGLEVLLDICLAVRCDRFIGVGSSSVSCTILRMKPRGWAPGTAALVGPMITSKPDPVVLMSLDQLERFMEPAQVAAWRLHLV